MNWNEAASLAALSCGLLGAAAPARAAVQAPGPEPMQVGPSWAQADPARASALLGTVIVNHGRLADRLIRVECPASGQVALRNATLHDDIATPAPSQQHEAEAVAGIQNGGMQNGGAQNGLDLPPVLHGQSHPVTALIDLTRATQPLTVGALVPCTVTFAHRGDQIVIFSVREQPHPTAEP